MTHTHRADPYSACVICQRFVRGVGSDGTRPLYDACGCIAPCPDHRSIAQEGRQDRAYWADRYADPVPGVDQEQD
jgi:hypothetical protein